MDATTVIMDCDNTFGVQGCDVDDGLALLFLLGCDNVTVDAVCTTYGNNSIDVVQGATERLLAEWGIALPLYRGAANPNDVDTPAARAIAQRIASADQPVHLLATGALTNLKAAAKADPSLFSHTTSVSAMGGITRTLTVNGTVMHELNFSCDPAATARVLGATCPVRIATAQNCLPNYFSRDEFAARMGAQSWLSRRCAYWFDDMARAGYGDGFVCWDVVAAALIARPDLFIDKTMRVTINERLFAAGYLEEAAEDAPSTEIHVPEIADPRAFREACLATWSKACKKLGLA